ncbi:MAG: glycine cleavage system protein GcvH [Gemmataceae bacterium]
MDLTKLRFLKTHEWASLEKNIVTVGISQFAADQLTDITFVELPDVGDHVFANQEFGNIETVKAVNDLYAPLDGEVVEVNSPLEEDPAPVKNDPYGAGWLIKIRIEKPALFEHLLSAEQYKKQVASEQH